MATTTHTQRRPITADPGPQPGRRIIGDHPIEIALFDSTGPITLVWLAVRLWLGWQWLSSGLEKLQNPAWMNGTAIVGFWKNAAGSYGQPHSAVAYGWYADFLNSLVSSNSQAWVAP